MVIAVIAAAIVLVGSVLGGAYYIGARSGGKERITPSAVSTDGVPSYSNQPPSTNGQTKPVYYNSSKSWSLWNSLNTAAQDSKPLTLEEVFSDPEAKAQKDSSAGLLYSMQGMGQLDSDCTRTVWGASLQIALRNYGCTQVVRAAYVSSDRRWVGQLAIFNLKDVVSANALLEDLDPKSGGKGFYLPVAGPSPVDQFGKGTTGAESGAYGHFVVVGWASNTDGGQASTSDTISPSSAVERAGKKFLFQRNN